MSDPSFGTAPDVAMTAESVQPCCLMAVNGRPSRARSQPTVDQRSERSAVMGDTSVRGIMSITIALTGAVVSSAAGSRPVGSLQDGEVPHGESWKTEP